MICGYIILFRILSVFLGNAWQLWMPPAAEVIITGLLELAGGCCRLPALESAGLRYLLASGFWPSAVSACICRPWLSLTPPGYPAATTCSAR